MIQESTQTPKASQIEGSTMEESTQTPRNSQIEEPTMPESTQASITSKILKTNAIRSWKTTVIGVTLSFTGFVSFSPQTFGGEPAIFVQVCKYITSGGLAALGIVAKDFNVSGEDRNE
jgi:hypothetical protein